MRALSFPAAGRVEVIDVPRPDLPDGHVRLAVEASGLCHTDLAILEGGYGPGTFPLIPGHEYCGRIAERGEGVTGFVVGDRVVVDPNIGCGVCRACRAGRVNLCAFLGAYGVTRAGGFAQESIVRADKLVAIAEMPAARAALAEPLGCVINGLRAAHLMGDASPPESAVVFGAGPIGQLLALALRARGAGSVTLVDLDEDRLAMASRLGFAVASAADAQGKSFHRAFDFAAEATGVPAVIEALPERITDGGTALVMGVAPQDARIAVSPYDFFRRQITLVGSHSLNTGDVAEAVAMLGSNGVHFDALVTHRLPLEGIAPILIEGLPKGALKVHYTADAA